MLTPRGLHAPRGLPVGQLYARSVTDLAPSVNPGAGGRSCHQDWQYWCSLCLFCVVWHQWLQHLWMIPHVLKASFAVNGTLPGKCVALEQGAVTYGPRARSSLQSHLILRSALVAFGSMGLQQQFLCQVEGWEERAPAVGTAPALPQRRAEAVAGSRLPVLNCLGFVVLRAQQLLERDLLFCWFRAHNFSQTWQLGARAYISSHIIIFG